MFDEFVTDSLHEECGVFGVFAHPLASQLTYYGLHALQHRGQESAGIVCCNQGAFEYKKGMGLVTEVFCNEDLAALKGTMAIGHVRYTTAGGSQIENAQPLVFNYREGTLALAHNGNLVNATQIKHYLERQGSIFQTTSDTEVLAHLIARSGYDDIESAVIEGLSVVKGAYAFLFMTKDRVIAALDPNGLRPLALGQIGEGYVVASETCAFDVIGAQFIREVLPGEMVVIDNEGIHSVEFCQCTQKTICSFEYIYFARPDSNIDGANVHQCRKSLGKRLAKEHPIDADVVTGVPDSSISAAIGFAEVSKIPYELALIKNRYVGRTFIQPNQELRSQGVNMKLSAVKKVVEGKRVVMVDDSIVRGTTSKRIVGMLREAGAKEVHVRISSPPLTNPCYYGIDISSREELIFTKKGLDQVREEIGADSLGFLSVEGLLDTIGRNDSTANQGLCLACFNGSYPTETYPEAVKGGARNGTKK